MIKLLVRGALLLCFMAVCGAGAVIAVLWHYGKGLPNYDQLADYQPPTVTRVHAGDGRLLAEYATEKRVFVPVDAMPLLVIRAFLSAEDKNFYTHPGIDFRGIFRAALQNAASLGSNKRPSGGSTITQQVAKNFLLTNEVSLARKAKEAILAFRIERVLSKQRILELYLNEIYLGGGSYGVAAAALNYFNKSLDQLTVGEAAYLAALPKAPSSLSPTQNPERAKARRDYVIERMAEDGVITAAEATAAEASPLVLKRRDAEEVVRADYFAEEVRRELLARYGETELYKGGLSVRTTLDPRLQAIADTVLRQGLINYDRRHGWRGAVGRLQPAAGLPPNWQALLTAYPQPPASGPWQLATVIKTDDQGAEIGLRDGKRGRIPMSELAWARPVLEDQRVGPSPRKSSDVFAAGDVILVEPVETGSDGKTKYPADSFGLRQIPDVGGAIVALDPHTGRVLAMNGGLSFEMSQFNRATQAMRQPGSSFKPFVYMAALDSGFTPSTLILDAPFVADQGPGLPKWKPQGFGRGMESGAGPTPLRVGIEKSRNLMTVRLADTIGMEKVASYAERFGVVDKLMPVLSMSLGAGETTVLRMTNAYAMIVNGGKRITPTLIDRIQDRSGKTIWRYDKRGCADCAPLGFAGQAPPDLPDTRERVVDATTAYQMVSILQGVVERGTGAVVNAVGKPLAGKTGTTNDSNDAWFVGFSADLAVGIFVGFDNPRTLGPAGNDTGSRIAAPMFRDFMMAALKNTPATPFRIPPGVKMIRVNPETGLLAQPGDRKVIYEAFKLGSEPGHEATEDGVGGGTATSGEGGGVLGGLY